MLLPVTVPEVVIAERNVGKGTRRVGDICWNLLMRGGPIGLLNIEINVKDRKDQWTDRELTWYAR